MWRSVVGARAFLSRRVVGKFQAIQNDKPKVTAFGFFGSENSRFFSPHSANQSDFECQRLSESAEFGESGAIPKIFYGVFEKSSVDHFEIDEIESVSFSSGKGIHEPCGDDSHANIDGRFPGSQEKEEEVCEIKAKQLEGFLSLLQGRGVGSLESSLNQMDLTLNVDFVVKVLERPQISGENLLRFFRCAMKDKPDFKVNTRALDALVCGVCSNFRKKDAYSLWDLIKEIGAKDKDLLNAEMFNKLIVVFSKLGLVKAAFEVFNKCRELGCVPNAETYYCTIDALCRRSHSGWASSVCRQMVDNGSLPDRKKVGKILSWLCEGKRVKEAHSVYLLSKEKRINPPMGTVYILATTLSWEDKTLNLAQEILDDFSDDVRKHAIRPFSSVLRGLCRFRKSEDAKNLLLKMISEGPPPGAAAFNAVINGYSKTGDLDEAIKLMRLMKDRGVKPDVFTYTVLISGYAKGGQMEEACEILLEAKKHSKLTPLTYHSLVRGYCKLEEFDKALKLLSEMKDFGFKADYVEYYELIQSLCLKAFDWEMAEKLLEAMKVKGLLLKGVNKSVNLKALDWETAEKLLEAMKVKGLLLKGVNKSVIRAVKELEEEVWALPK